VQIRQSFDLPFARNLVWGFFKKIEDVTECMPGASLVGAPSQDHAKFRMKIKLGPVSAEFLGDVDLANNDEAFTGQVRGKANDQRNNSSVTGEVQYALLAQDPQGPTTVDIVVDFDITGRLAQFSRSGVVTELAARITKDFAANLERRLDAMSAQAAAPAAAATAPGEQAAAPATAQPPAPAAQPEAYQVGGMLFSVIWWQIKKTLRALFGRSA
jgi:carbon monoxide dehydrogenase subunit G